VDVKHPVQHDDAAARALLGRCAIFRRCGAADLAALASSTRWIEHADGADLVREGDMPQELLVLEHGYAQVIKRGANGDEHVINRVGPRDSIGEMALFDIVPRSATVRADGPVRSLLQGPLSHFLTGRWRTWLAIVGANIIFSAAHLYVSPGLAGIAFVVGLFWGWLYARQGGPAGVSVSHVLLGLWAFELVGLGVLP